MQLGKLVDTYVRYVYIFVMEKIKRGRYSYIHAYMIGPMLDYKIHVCMYICMYVRLPWVQIQ